MQKTIQIVSKSPQIAYLVPKMPKKGTFFNLPSFKTEVSTISSRQGAGTSHREQLK